MNYKSTRDNSINVKSCEAIAKGLSAEGGLFIPESIPSVSVTQIGYMADMSYVERAREILGRFLTDFTEEELFPIYQIQYTDKTGCGVTGPVKIVLKNGEKKVICFEGLEAKMMI